MESSSERESSNSAKRFKQSSIEDGFVNMASKTTKSELNANPVGMPRRKFATLSANGNDKSNAEPIKLDEKQKAAMDVFVFHESDDESTTTCKGAQRKTDTSKQKMKSSGASRSRAKTKTNEVSKVAKAHKITQKPGLKPPIPVSQRHASGSESDSLGTPLSVMRKKSNMDTALPKITPYLTPPHETFKTPIIPPVKDMAALMLSKERSGDGDNVTPESWPEIALDPMMNQYRPTAFEKCKRLSADQLTDKSVNQSNCSSPLFSPVAKSIVTINDEKTKSPDIKSSPMNEREARSSLLDESSFQHSEFSQANGSASSFNESYGSTPSFNQSSSKAVSFIQSNSFYPGYQQSPDLFVSSNQSDDFGDVNKANGKKGRRSSPINSRKQGNSWVDNQFISMASKTESAIESSAAEETIGSSDEEVNVFEPVMSPKDSVVVKAVTAGDEEAADVVERLLSAVHLMNHCPTPVTKDTNGYIDLGTPLPEFNVGFPRRCKLRDDKSNYDMRTFSRFSYKDYWDLDHVRMPFSERNTFRDSRHKRTISKWDLITSAFATKIKTAHELEAAIRKYNRNRFDCDALIYYLNVEIEREEKKTFFDFILPSIIKLVMNTKACFPKTPPLLKAGSSQSLTLSQKQISCLLANAFLCTYPSRHATYGVSSPLPGYPTINFCQMFGGGGHFKLEKLKCIVHYFYRMASEQNHNGAVTFERRFVSEDARFDFLESKVQLKRVHISSRGLIESMEGMLQVDFANEYVGGGCLGHGMVQEEILFLVFPELIVSRLFTQVLSMDECLVVTGHERFSEYSGYRDSFKWVRKIDDCVGRDNMGRRLRQMVAIDAIAFSNPFDQYEHGCILRELIKASCGFSTNSCCVDLSDTPRAAVATGNWGCGAFRGDPELKSIIQLCAASLCGRDLVYLTFGNTQLCHDFHSLYEQLKATNTTVGDLVQILMNYKRGRGRLSVFQFIRQLVSYDCDTD